MSKNNNYKNNNYKNIFINKPKRIKFKIFKYLSLLTFILTFLLLSKLVLNYKYSNITNEFYSSFNKSEFDVAKSTLDNKWLYLKTNKLKKDLESYFTKIVDLTCDGLENKEITSSRAIEILNNIKGYNILNSSLDILIAYINENYSVSNQTNALIMDESLINNDPNNNISSATLDNYFTLGLNSYNSKDYSKAFKYFNLYLENSNSNDNLELATNYINKIKSEYKDYLLTEADNLSANKYYTMAINILSEYDTNILEDYDIDIYNKISSLELFKEEYSEDLYTSSAILDTITINNVNNFAIDSQTEYFVYVNLEEQMTYVYQGFLNNWNLVKSFISSTGLPGKETPKGIFSVTSRGDWFFSEEFNQGGKYWVQFMGDYLFHSVPFDRNQETILDNALGNPASHGCIRLSLEDSKWLYENITDNTKIIIN